MEIKISDELNSIIRYAREEAMRTGSYGIGPDHLFLGMMRHSDNDACRLLAGLGVDIDEFKRFIDSHIFTNESIPYSEADKVSFSRYAQNVLSITVMEASKMNASEATSLHLMLALCRTTENYGQAYLRQHGVDYGRLLARQCVRTSLSPIQKMATTSLWKLISRPNATHANIEIPKARLLVCQLLCELVSFIGYSRVRLFSLFKEHLGQTPGAPLWTISSRPNLPFQSTPLAHSATSSLPHI